MAHWDHRIGTPRPLCSWRSADQGMMTRSTPVPTWRAPGDPVRFLSGVLAVLLFCLMPNGALCAGLSGRVLRENGTPAAGIAVLARSPEVGWSRAARTDGEGRFELEDVPAGPMVLSVPGSAAPGNVPWAAAVDIPEDGRAVITLRAAPQAGTFQFKLYRGRYYDNRADAGSADPVSVAGGGTTGGIHFSLAQGGGFISGRVTADAGGAPIPGLIVVALGRNDFALSFDRTDSDGRYRIGGLPADSYFVSVNAFLLLDDNDYVTEFYNNTSDIALALDVVVTNGAETPNIDFGLALGGSVRGRVTAEAGGAGIPFSAVTARSTANAAVFTTTLADENGDYAIRGLKPGTWTVSADAEGNFLTEYYNNRSTPGSADPVTVTSGNATTGIHLSLPAGGAVLGTIRNQSTLAPLSGYLVEATRVSDFFSRTAQTQADGTYRIEGLPTGTFRVGVPQLTKWYNNRSSAQTADPVNITAGMTVAGIDISGFPPGACTPGVGAALSGTVTGNGSPLFGASVTLWRTLGNQRVQVTGTETALDGSFSLPCLDAGTWFARVTAPFTPFLPRWYDNADSAAATPIVLTNGVPRTGVNVNLSAGASITGRVTAGDTGLPLRAAEVMAMRTPSGTNVSTALTDDNGDYVLNSSPDGGLSGGTYIVWTNDVSTTDVSLVPVRLVSFAAEADRDAVLVRWEIAEEEAGSAFLLDRAVSDGGRFSAPARVTERPLSGGTAFAFRDAGVTSGTLYRYDLTAVDRAGRTERLGEITVRAGVSGTPRILSVAPNPLRESTVVRFSLPEPGPVTLRVFDMNGRLIRTLVDETREAGQQESAWDGRDDSGSRAPAGVYFVALRDGVAESRVRVVLAR